MRKKEIRHFSYLVSVANSTSVNFQIDLQSIKNPGAVRLCAAWLTVQYNDNVAILTESANGLLAFTNASTSRTATNNYLPSVSAIHGRVDFKGECFLPTVFNISLTGWKQLLTPYPVSYGFDFIIDFELEVSFDL